MFRRYSLHDNDLMNLLMTWQCSGSRKQAPSDLWIIDLNSRSTATYTKLYNTAVEFW